MKLVKVVAGPPERSRCTWWSSRLMQCIFPWAGANPADCSTCKYFGTVVRHGNGHEKQKRYRPAKLNFQQPWQR